MSPESLRRAVLALSMTILLTACGSNAPTETSTSTATSTSTLTESAPEEIATAPPPMFVPPEVEEAAPQKDTFEPPESFFDPKTLDTPLPFFVPPPLEAETATVKKILKTNKGGKAVHIERTKLQGIPLYKMVIDLDDPQTLLTVELPHGVKEANSAQVTHGDETFDSFNKRKPAAMMANGTFFSKDDEKRVMGNLVSEGQFRKYSQWENYGTTFGIKANNELEMVTARREGQPRWEDYWFSLTCGPRLLRDGKPDIAAADEGFQDSHVFTIGPRSAIGFNRAKHQIIYCAFLRGLSLEREADLMKAVGCDEAMNLDGGASRALAADGKIVLKAGRPLTNVIVIYDTCHPAPSAVADSWNRFQNGERPRIPNDVASAY